MVLLTIDTVVEQVSSTHSSCITELLVIEKYLPISFFSQPLTTMILPSASMNLTILATSYKWNHAVFVFL